MKATLHSVIYMSSKPAVEAGVGLFSRQGQDAAIHWDVSFVAIQGNLQILEDGNGSHDIHHIVGTHL